MGWGRMFLLGDWGQQMDIQEQRREIESLRHEMRHRRPDRGEGDLSVRVDRLERENDELRLYLASLVRYLGNKGLLQREEFASLIDAVDAEDGASDGRFRGEIGA